MIRFASLGLVSVAALGLTLIAPATSHAQSFGVHVDLGRTRVQVSNGYSYLPSQTYRYDPYRSNYYGQSYSNYNHGDCHPRPVVVPQYQHWTPDRGYHSHGQILVPHRNHYHVRPY